MTNVVILQTMANVIISDSQFIVRHGLYDLLQANNHQIIGLSKTKNELNNQLTDEVDVLVIDYNKLTGFEIDDIGQIKTEFPQLSILAISNYSSKQEVLKAIEMGVLSFLTTDCDQREILDAVDSTAKGDKFFCNKVLDFILEGQIAKPKLNCNPSVLSERELQVVQEMALGQKAKQIANKFDISIHTVYTHQKNIMKKLEVNSSTEVVLHAINSGLVSN